MSELQLTADYLLELCQRTFPNRAAIEIVRLEPLPSRQHEMVSFVMQWQDDQGMRKATSLVARRYVSTISWWRPDDMGKAQREWAITEWLSSVDFPVPQSLMRTFSSSGDVVLFRRLPGYDWHDLGLPFLDAVEPHAEAFARLLAYLHSLTPPDEVRAVLPTVTLPTALATLIALARRIDQQDLIEAIELALHHAYNVQEQPPVILHGDYHFSNALLHDGEISGIIDWEFCALGDPRWDVANAYMQLVDFDAAHAADIFLQTYLEQSGRRFEGPPLYNAVAPLQQWTISEWLVHQGEVGESMSFALAEDLIDLRDVHRRRAERALRSLS
ncbi:MAG: phosphotransferase [Chloroflexi bacterium]|nr:phosphotransferase [Chloroflexota bacterium]